MHPGQGAAEGTDLSPSCSPLLMSKTRSMWYRLGHIGEERLSFHLARFLLFHLKAVIKEVLVLCLGTKSTTKPLTSSLICAAATGIPWHDGRRDVDSTILCYAVPLHRLERRHKAGLGEWRCYQKRQRSDCPHSQQHQSLWQSQGPWHCCRAAPTARFHPSVSKNPASSFAAQAPQEAHFVFQGRLGYPMEKPVFSANKQGTSLGFCSEVRYGKSKTRSAPGLIIAWPKVSLCQQRWSPCQRQHRLCSRVAAGLSNLQAFLALPSAVADQH